MVVKHIWLYNAGENKKLQERAEIKDWEINIDFKYTEQYTPHKNYPEGMGFFVLAKKGRSMIYRANVPKEMKYKIFPKAF